MKPEVGQIYRDSKGDLFTLSNIVYTWSEMCHFTQICAGATRIPVVGRDVIVAKKFIENETSDLIKVVDAESRENDVLGEDFPSWADTPLKRWAYTVTVDACVRASRNSGAAPELLFSPISSAIEDALESLPKDA